MYTIFFRKKRGEKRDNSDKPRISLNENTGDPSDFTLYTSDNIDIASQLDYEKHVSNTITNDSAQQSVAQPIPIEEAPTSTGKPSNRGNRYSQASKSNYPRTFTRSERNRASTTGQVNLHQNAMLQNADILMQHGLQIPDSIPLPPMGLWNPNIMGFNYQLFGVNDVIMNPHVMPGMPNYKTVGNTLQPDMLIPKPLFPGNYLPEPMFVENNLLELSSSRAITPIRQPIDCNSCMVHPPSKGSALPLVQKKPLGCLTIFVGGIPRNTTRMIIHDIFRRFGNITDIRMNSKFCHVRFGQETSVDAALCFSGCRVTIGKSQHPDDSGLIFVDYSKRPKMIRSNGKWNRKNKIKEAMAQQQNVKKVMAKQQNVKEATSISWKEKLDTALVLNSKIESSVSASSTILAQIKTEPVKKPVISEEKTTCDQTTINITKESITLKQIKKEPTDDKSANFKVNMSSSVHDKNKQDVIKDQEQNSAISRTIFDVKKETVEELDKQDNGTHISKTETIAKKKRKVKAMYSEDTFLHLTE